MTEEVLFSHEGQLGLITLNRPNALNALTLEMIQAIQQQLAAWKTDSRVKAVVVRAVPGKAFCAGGDVRWLYQHRGQLDKQMAFFWHEYRLNHFIHHLGKPYIALMDGMTMGGGVGISLHGSHPIASERFIFAMPETSIGFFPDIGASHLLTRCGDALGTYLGLTGNHLGAHAAMQSGLVRQVVVTEQMPLLLEALLQEDLSVAPYVQVDHCIAQFANTGGSGEPLPSAPPTLACFLLPTVEQIQHKLQESNDPWAAETLKTLSQKCPFSLKITLLQLQKAKDLSLAECLKMDFALVNHFMTASHFYEGVRALLVDKDKNPLWEPASLELISESQCQDYFEVTQPLAFMA